MDEYTATEWQEVGSLLNGLGLKLKYHAEQAMSEDRARVDDALQSLCATIEGSFDALKGAVTDEAVREDLKGVASGVARAVSSALSGFGKDIRDRAAS